VVGANLTDTTTEAPAASVLGIVIPLTLKLAGARNACADMLSDDVPVFLMVTETDLLEPVATDPKLTEVGLSDNVPAATAI
jgi:hypothetical protein